MTELEKELATKIDPTISEEIVKEYNELKTKYGLRDYPACIRAAGAFCESVMKALLFLRDGKITSKMGLKFNDAFNDIMNKTPQPSDIRQEYTYRLVPPVVKSIYEIRNKKWGSHARGLELLSMDLQLVATSADWIIASLLFVSHGVSENEAFRMMSDLINRNTPLLIKFGKHNVLAIRGIKAKEALVVSVSCIDGPSSVAEIGTILSRRWSRQTIDRVFDEADNELLIFVDENDIIHLLPEGRKLAEKIAAKNL